MLHHAARHLMLLTALLVAGLLSSAAPASVVWAGHSACRTDPVLTLSNGATMILYADISTSIDQVVSVQYVAHIPRGVSVTSITFPDGYGYLEQVSWQADQAAASYSTNTVVTTRTSGITTSVFESVQLANSSYRSQTVTGVSPQQLRTLIVLPK